MCSLTCCSKESEHTCEEGQITMDLRSVEKEKNGKGKKQTRHGDPADIDTQCDGGYVRQPHGRQINGLDAIPYPWDRIVHLFVMSCDKAFAHYFDDRQHVGVAYIDGYLLEPIAAPGIHGQGDQPYQDESIVVSMRFPPSFVRPGEVEIGEGGQHEGYG